MTTEELAKIVMDRIDDLDGGYSFAEMKRDLAKCIDVEGDMAIELECAPNCILWCGVNERFYDVFNHLWTSDLIRLEPVAKLVYVIDGICLSLPLVKRMPKGGYKKPHWLPVVMYRNAGKDDE